MRAAAAGLLTEAQLEALDAPLRIEGSVKGLLADASARAELRGGLLGGELRAKARYERRRFESDVEWKGGSLERALAALELPASGLSGRLEARVAAGGDAARLDLQADIEADARGAGLAHNLQATLAGSVAPRTMGLDARYQVRLGTRASGTAGTLRTARLSLAGTARGVRTPDVQGRLEGQVALRTPAGEEALRVGGQLRARGAALGADIEAQDTSVSLRASLAANGSLIDSLRLEGRADDLARLVPNAAGRVELSLVARGPVAALDAEGRMTGEGMAWKGVALGPLTLSGRSERGRGRLELALPDWRVAGQAQLQDGRLSGTARLEDTPLEPFSALAPRPIAGRLAANVHFDAPLKAPKEGLVTADVSTLELRSAGLAARAARPFRLRLEGETLRLEDAALEGEGVLLEASGEARASGALDLATRVRLDLARASLPEPWTATGILESEARLGGSLQSPSLTGFAKVTDFVLAGAAGGSPLLRGPAELRFEGDRVSIVPSDVSLAGGSLRLEGGCRSAPSAPWPAALRLRLSCARPGPMCPCRRWRARSARPEKRRSPGRSPASYAARTGPA